MARHSAGLLLTRLSGFQPEFLLAHPGGPLFARKDDGAWTIPKGIPEPGEELFETAKREFREETGFSLPDSDYIPLGEVRQKSGKRVHCWLCFGDCDPSQLQSNLFEMEWPPRSGRRQSFVEVDRADFFSADAAKVKLLTAQTPFIDRALAAIAERDA